jgi:nitrite reductase/ring-hydroxylating ferredoxin subunit
MKENRMNVAAHHWWPLALAEEVSAEKPLGVRCAGRELVLFRDQGGVARSLEDRCAHRRAPLSLGKIMPGGLLACPYHGWRYEGATGRCRMIPNLSAQEIVPAIYRVENFAVIERGGLVFVWAGAVDEAHERGLPPSGLLEGFSTAPHRGSTLLTIGQKDFVTALLDSPDLLFRLDDVAVVPFHPHGDPSINGGVLAVERAADFALALAARGQALADYPFRLRISAVLGTGTARLDLTTEAGAQVFSVLVASAPAADSVTAVHWRATAAGFAVRDRVDAAALLALVPQAAAAWRGPAAFHHSLEAPST